MIPQISDVTDHIGGSLTFIVALIVAILSSVIAHKLRSKNRSKLPLPPMAPITMTDVINISQIQEGLEQIEFYFRIGKAFLKSGQACSKGTFTNFNTYFNNCL